jgi:exonuclease III
MKKLQIDILCLQEVKLGEDQITFDPIEQNSPGLDCFFSWSGKKTGFNGVATIARRGLTVSATRALGPNGSLHDSAGRFLLTDHGEFVLINLYVHNDGDGGVNVPVKMDFLLRVRAQVESLRAAGRRMIVAGDLNLKLRALDVPWSGRSADIEALRCSQFVAGEAELVTRLRDQLAEEENWKTFRESVAQIVEVESRSRFTYRLDNKQLKSTVLL